MKIAKSTQKQKNSGIIALGQYSTSMSFASQRKPIAFGTFAETNSTMASARQIRDEIMKMTIVVNSDPAQKAIYELTKQTSSLTDKKRDLSRELKETEKLLGKESDEYKALSKEILQTNRQITANAKEMERLRGEMDLTQMTMSQLKKEAALLRTNLNNMIPGSQASIEMQTQLDRVNARMAEVRTGANQTRTSFRGLADTFNHYQGIVVAGMAIFAGFALSVQQVIDRNNKLVDAQTAVAKTVNMTKQEVDDLTKSFSTFDTRTSRIDLLKIAETGGRLGVGKEQIKEFVREVDKANVALGDGFAGGVEAVTDTLGKLKNLYGETKDLDMATAINQIGSAMNELGANGAATEQNIGEFALRLGSLPAKLKPTIAESLALGAAFEESGINAERAGTAYSTFVRNAATNSEKFAKVMGISKKEVESLMNTDPLEFFLKFSEGMKGMDTTDLAKTMEYLKMNDQYVIATMGAASENTDRFRKSIELSNKSLTEATSLTDEFNKVNNNTSAIFDKVQKKFLGMFTSEAVANTLNFLIGTFGKFIGAVEDSEGTVTTFRNGIVFLMKVIVLMMATMVSYNLVTGAYNALMVTAYQRVIGLTVVEKARNAVMVLSNGIATLYRATLWLLAAGYSLVTGNTVGATFAMRGFTAAIMANPLGALLGLITLVAGAYLSYKGIVSDTTKVQKSLNDVMKEGTANATNDIAALEVLYKTATNVKLSTEERTAAVKKLKAEFPGYFSQIDDEIIMNGKAAKSYHELRAAIVASARSKAAEAELEKREGDRFKQREQWKEDYRVQLDDLNRLKKNLAEMEKSGQITGNRRLEMVTRIQGAENNLNKMIAKGIAAKIADQKADAAYIDAISKNKLLAGKLTVDEIDDPSKSSYNTNLEKEKKEKNPKKGEADRLAREKERYDKMMRDWMAKGEASAELARQIELNISDARIEAMEDGFLKEMIQLSLQEERRMAEIDKKKYQESDFKNIDATIEKAKGKDKDFLRALKASWIKINDELENQKLAEMAVFANKRDALQFKFEKKHLDQQNELHQTALGRLKREENEEIASYTTLAELKAGLKGRIDDKELQRITTFAQGKEALNKIYQKKELDLQIAHLEEMVKMYEALDLSVLTPEQQKVIMGFLDEALNKVAELKAKRTGINTTGEEKLTLGRKAPTDILGLSQDDWAQMFDNFQTGADKLGTVMAAVSALHNAFGAYYQFVEANEKRQMQQIEQNTNRKKRGLKKQLDEGYINQETYKKLTIKADQDLEKKKIEFAVRQAKREKAMAISSTIMNTAQAIMGIWAQVPKGDFGIMAGILSGVVGVMGAMQVATIMSQPLPTAEGFEEGFGMEYPITRAQDGKRFNVRKSRLKSTLVDRPTHFIAGENNKVEMVIDSPTWTSYAPQLKNAIYAANARANGFESGFNMKKESTQASGGNDEIMIKMMSLMSKNIEVLEYIRDTPPIAIIQKNARNGKEVDEMREEYLNLKNKNKH